MLASPWVAANAAPAPTETVSAASAPATTRFDFQLMTSPFGLSVYAFHLSSGP